MTSRFSVEGLRDEGFEGFATVSDIHQERCSALPTGPGVYVVLRTSDSAPRLLRTSTGGHFKGQDPTVPQSVLRSRILDRTPVMYIGKANALRRRVRQLLDFGHGKPVGHWGGRYLWQVAGSNGYLIAWRQDPAPRDAEVKLLAAFVSEFGTLPFANLSM